MYARKHIKNETRDILKLSPHVYMSLLSGYSLACKSPTLAQVLVPMSPAGPRSSTQPYLLEPLNLSMFRSDLQVTIKLSCRCISRRYFLAHCIIIINSYSISPEANYPSPTLFEHNPITSASSGHRHQDFPVRTLQGSGFHQEEWGHKFLTKVPNMRL